MSNPVLINDFGDQIQPHKPALSKHQAKKLKAILAKIIQDKDYKALEAVVNTVKHGFQITKPICINLIANKEKELIRIPLLQTIAISPYVQNQDQYIVLTMKEQNDDIYIKRGSLQKMIDYKGNQTEQQVRCRKTSQLPFQSGSRFLPNPIVKFSQFEYNATINTTKGRERIPYYPFIVLTQQLLSAFIMEYDEQKDKATMFQFDLIDVEEQNQVLTSFSKGPMRRELIDAQFDNFRENAIWVLMKHLSLKLYTVLSISLDVKFNYNGSKQYTTHIANEEQLLSPSLFKKNDFEPLAMHQYFNKSLNCEYLFLMSGSKLCMYLRMSPHFKYEKHQKAVPFTPYFIVDYLDLLGMKRRLQFLSEYCDINDQKFIDYKTTERKDELKDMQQEDFYLFMKGAIAQNKRLIFDSDDEIVVLPDFISRKINQALVIPSAKLPLLAKLSSMFHVQKVEENPLLGSGIGIIVEEGPSLEETLINHVEICSKGKSVRGQVSRFNKEYSKLILVSNYKSVSFWGIKDCTESNIVMNKLMNVVPFTQFNYLNKLQLTYCCFNVIPDQENNDTIEVYCFTMSSKCFKFSLIV